MDLESMYSISSLEALSKLLTLDQEEEEEHYDNMTCSGVASLSPGHIGPSKTTQPQVPSKEKGTNGNDIWDAEEVQEGSEFDDILDHREQPEYDIIFKQKVAAEDVFLGMSRKDPSTACCEAMLIRIKLPGIKSADVVLDVREKFLDLRTPKQGKLQCTLLEDRNIVCMGLEDSTIVTSEGTVVTLSLPNERQMKAVSLEQQDFGGLLLQIRSALKN